MRTARRQGSGASIEVVIALFLLLALMAAALRLAPVETTYLLSFSVESYRLCPQLYDLRKAQLSPQVFHRGTTACSGLTPTYTLRRSSRAI